MYLINCFVFSFWKCTLIFKLNLKKYLCWLLHIKFNMRQIKIVYSLVNTKHSIFKLCFKITFDRKMCFWPDRLWFVVCLYFRFLFIFFFERGGGGCLLILLQIRNWGLEMANKSISIKQFLNNRHFFLFWHLL